MEEEQQQLTKKQRRELHKQEKLAEAKAVKSKKRLRSMVVTIISLFVVVGLGWGLISLAKRAEANKPGELVRSMGNDHINESDPHEPYNTIPPTSGPHAGTARWGNSFSQISDESQVHNLEDGGIGIQYDCDKSEESCDKLINQLLDVMVPYKDKVFMGPYEGIGNRIALTAWQRIEKFDKFDEQRIINFIEEYIGIDHHVRK